MSFHASFKSCLSFMLGLCALAAGADARANLIDLTYGAGVGSFEVGNYIDGGGIFPSGPGWMGVASGDNSTITGWTVSGPGNGVDWTAEPRGKVADFAPRGYIGLQNHDDISPVYFRNIRVKALD